MYERVILDGVQFMYMSTGGGEANDDSETVSE